MPALIQDIENETWRWYSPSSGYFGPEFYSEHDARMWYSKDIADI